MDQTSFYAYRAYGDRAHKGEMTMSSDPHTGDDQYLHAAGDVLVFPSEEERDAYVAQAVVITHLGGGGRDRRFHRVIKLSAEEGQAFQERCAASRICIHKSHLREGRVRIPE